MGAKNSSITALILIGVFLSGCSSIWTKRERQLFSDNIGEVNRQLNLSVVEIKKLNGFSETNQLHWMDFAAEKESWSALDAADTRGGILTRSAAVQNKLDGVRSAIVLLESMQNNLALK